MKKQGWMITILVMAVAALGTWWFLATFKYVTRERELPSTGEARYNPLYALKLSLRELGQQVDAHARLELQTLKLQAKDMLVLYASPNGLSDKQLDELLLPCYARVRGNQLVAEKKVGEINDGGRDDWVSQGIEQLRKQRVGIIRRVLKQRTEGQQCRRGVARRIFDDELGKLGQLVRNRGSGQELQ